MFKIIRIKETSQTAVVTGSKQKNGDNLNNMRHNVSRHFRNKMQEYLKDKINELATNSKNKNIKGLCRGINEFKRCYKPRRNLVKDENDNMLAHSHILNRWKNYISQLLNVHKVTNVRQIEIHSAEQSVPGPSTSEVNIATAKF
jgi:hypothetical protein